MEVAHLDPVTFGEAIGKTIRESHEETLKQMRKELEQRDKRLRDQASRITALERQLGVIE